MDDGLSISIVYNGEELSFEARIATTGYTHNFMVTINGIEVTYEPDEERNYRAIVSADIGHALKDKERSLIQLVAEKLDSLKNI